MSKNCFKPALVRDGTNRHGRLPEGLKDGFVQIDERSYDELVNFTATIARYFVFYNDNNQDSGTWQDFFNQQLNESGHTAPHFALFSAFLDLYAIAQADVNALGAKHLEFFYRDVLGFAENEAVPDQVFLIGELAKHVAALELEAGTLFKTGKKTNDIEKLYALKDDYSFNKSALSNLKSIYVQNGERLHTSPVSNSADGQGTAFAEGETDWLPFGDNTRPEKSYGFAVESPVLRMAEGERTVTLTVTFSSAVNNGELASSDFIIQATGEKGWIAPDKTGVSAIVARMINGNQLELKFTFTKAAKPIIDYNTEVHGTEFISQYPVLKIEMKEGAGNDARAVLKGLQANRVDISVTVDGVKNLILQNENGVLDPAKPVQPFGARPLIGSRFYIGSNEVFSKQLTQLTASFNWRNLPAVGFKDYYANYHSVPDDDKPAIKKFKILPSVLRDNSWDDGIKISLFDFSLTEEQETKLKEEKEKKAEKENDFLDKVTEAAKGGKGDDEPADNVPKTECVWSFSGIFSLTTAPETDAGKRFTTVTNSGYLAVALQESDFLHDEYQLSYGKGILLGLDKTDKTKQLDYVPNNPYTPELEEFELKYTATDSINLQSVTGTQYGKFYHCWPFGTAVRSNLPAIIPPFPNEGEMYIGLSQCVSPQNVTLLVQLAEGSSNPEVPKATVLWGYLSNNNWVQFAKTELLREGTNGLLKTGLVTLSIPTAATNTNTWLPQGNVWLRASVAANSAAVCKLIEVIPQAAQAEFYSHSGLEPQGETLLAKTISKLLNPVSSIKSFSQPYASFGGAAKESGSSFYVRVAERLRHKNRAVAVWDYERLVLKHFPNVHMVKAISHTSFNGGSGYAPLSPGHVTVVLVPDAHNQNALNPLQPKVSVNTLDEVKTFLKTCTTPHATLEVQNPVYEEIRVKLQVRYREGEDVGLSTVKLKEEITAMLAPWTKNEQSQVVFDDKMHKSAIIYQVEKLDYVDYIQCVEMYIHAPAWLGIDSNKDWDVAEASTSASVFTSYYEHTIEELEGEGCFCDECADNVVATTVFNEPDDCGCN